MLSIGLACCFCTQAQERTEPPQTQTPQSLPPKQTYQTDEPMPGAKEQAAQPSDAAIQPAPKTQINRLLEIAVGPTAYRGDLYEHYRKWSSAVHIGLKFNKHHRLNGHLNAAIGTIVGQNMDYVFTGESETAPAPNHYFKTSFVSVNYDLQVNLIKTSSWIVYVSQGIGFMRFNPKDEYGTSLQGQLTTRPIDETYGNVTIMLPTQAGVMYLFPNGYGAGLQGGWANPQTDFLDNISLWGNRAKKDNIFWLKFQFVVPLTLSRK